MPPFKRYVKDRDEAMLAYLVKVMTLESMIMSWRGAPAELRKKVRQARRSPDLRGMLEIIRKNRRPGLIKEETL